MNTQAEHYSWVRPSRLFALSLDNSIDRAGLPSAPGALVVGVLIFSP